MTWTSELDWLDVSQRRMEAVDTTVQLLSYDEGTILAYSQAIKDDVEWYHGRNLPPLSEEQCKEIARLLRSRQVPSPVQPSKLQVNETKPNIWLRLIDGWKQGRTLPTDSATRREIPVYSGAIAYFPAALACVAACSARGTAEHQLGALYHDRTKTETAGHLDCEIRHLIDRGDEPDELVHAASKAWRALADLQLLCERLGAPLAPGAKKPQ